MTKTLAAALLALSLPTACGSVESPTDDMQQDPDMMEETPENPEETPPTPPSPVAGTIDTSFGANGYLPLYSLLGYPVDMGLQGDKLVVCSNATIDGKARAVLARFGFDGSVDQTFGIQNGRYEMSDNSYCGGVIVRPDNRLVMFIRIPGSLNAMIRFDADAQTFDATITGSSLKAMNLGAGNKLLAAATTPTGFSARDVENPSDIASIASLTGTATRPFLINDKHAIAGVFTNGMTGWTLMLEEADGQFSMPSKLLNVGNPATNDFMHDAVQLADGSILAVGGADSDIDAVVGRLSPTADPVAQVRDIGLTSTFRRVLLDGSDHALLFGTSTSGTAQIMWQRIATSTLAVDPDYANGGTMITPAYHGSGDLSRAIHYNGAIYALTSYDVETSTPGAALLKIHE